MLSRRRRGLFTGNLLVLTALLCSAPSAMAQGQDQSPLLATLAKQVILDPTTYAPAIISYQATYLDWKTSQPFFQHGYFEQNPRFTISGLPNDVAVGYGEGNRRILIDALGTFEASVINNAASRLMERSLLERHPEHRKLIRTVGWIERSVVASYLSYILSQAHYRQWQQNQHLAQQMGY
jgi:hypothetical protein